MTDPKYCVVTTTCANKEDAQKIIEPLLEKKLAACVQVFNIESHYFWKDAIQHEPELILMIKAKASLYPEIEKTIKENHKYEVPEIIQTPVTNGASSYLGWIDEVSK